jgi:hypothetical protein
MLLYAAWWRKPNSLSRPLTIRDSQADSIIAFMAIASFPWLRQQYGWRPRFRISTDGTLPLCSRDYLTAERCRLNTNDTIYGFNVEGWVKDNEQESHRELTVTKEEVRCFQLAHNAVETYGLTQIPHIPLARGPPTLLLMSRMSLPRAVLSGGGANGMLHMDLTDIFSPRLDGLCELELCGLVVLVLVDALGVLRPRSCGRALLHALKRDQRSFRYLGKPTVTRVLLHDVNLPA